MKKEILNFRKGYGFARHLAGDIDDKKYTNSKLYKYHLSIRSFGLRKIEPYSLGVLIYGLIHREDDKKISGLLFKLLKKNYELKDE